MFEGIHSRSQEANAQRILDVDCGVREVVCAMGVSAKDWSDMERHDE